MIEYNALCKVSTQHKAQLLQPTDHRNIANTASKTVVAKSGSVFKKLKDQNKYLRATNQCFTLYRPGLCKVDLLWMHSFPNISKTIHYFQNFL